MKRFLCITGMIFLLLCSACGKRVETENRSETETTFEITTETTVAAPFSLETYANAEEPGVYNLGGLVENLSEVVYAGIYDTENILLLRVHTDGTEKILQVSTLSLETGVESKKAEINLGSREDMDDYFSYGVLNLSPLIVQDYNADSYYVFNEDFTAENEILLDMDAYGGVYSQEIEALCLMNYNERKLYSFDISEYVESDAVTLGTPVTISDKTLLWSPEFNMGDASLDAISEDGSKLRFSVDDLTTEDYDSILVEYDISSGTYETYCYEDFYATQSAFDTSWTLDFVYEEEEESTGLSFHDYNAGVEYRIVPSLSAYESGEADAEEIETEDGKEEQTGGRTEDTYSAGTSDAQDTEDYGDWEDYGAWEDEGDYEDFFWLDLGKYAYHDSDYILLEVMSGMYGNYEDLLLWDYKKSEKQTPCTPIVREDYSLPEEIDYGAVTRQAEELEEKYGVQIIMGENVKNQFPDYTAETVVNEELMTNALTQIDAALELYPQGFLEELTENSATGINLYLTGALTPIDGDTYISTASAVTSQSSGYHMVALDITLWGTRETLLHEMSHVIDNKFGNDGLIDDLNEKWAECNPPGFDYYYNYFDYEGDTENTSLAEEYWVDWNPEIVYFYDDYAKTYPGEDRARVMEHFTDWDTLEDCYSSSHLQKKIGVYLDFLEAHFESCQDGNYLWRELYNQLVTGE